jgi:Spy/CpxP family protein refolding chaperone
MRRFFGITLPLLAVCMLAGNVALAQGRGGRGGFGGFGGMGGGGAGMLLGNPQVQKELKMSEDQTAKVGEIQRDMFAGFGRGGGGAGGGGQNLSDEERQKQREEFQKKAEENNKKMLALLDDGQNARLKQIQLWTMGVAGLAADQGVAKETATALKLTDDQKEALKTITQESGKKSGEIFGGFRGADEETRTKLTAQLTEIRKETESECLAVLTDEQKAQFDKMKGPKFELDMSAFGRGGPGGGRRGGRPNN